jgi:uncharacterized protein YaiE (UPF0345 family)
MKKTASVLLCAFFVFMTAAAGCARTVTSTDFRTQTMPVTVPITTTLTSDIIVVKTLTNNQTNVITTTLVTGCPYPVTVLPNIQTSGIVNGTVLVSTMSWYFVNFSITATMINPVVTGSIAVLTPGATAWVQIYTSGDSDSAPQYETGNVTAATINAALPFRSYKLLIGTSSSAAVMQVLANINLVYFR